MATPPTRPPIRRPAVSLPGTGYAGQAEDYGDEYASLGYQTEQQHKTRDSRAYKDIFDPDKTEGMSFFKEADGINLVDIIPFPVGPRHPEVCVRKKMQPGQRAYVLEVWAHHNVGPNNDQYLCLARTYGKPCPICEFRQSDEPGADAKELTPKRRSIFAVWDRKHEDKGLQIWEIAHFFMDKQLQARVINPKTGAKINFAHPSKAEGKHISFDLKRMGRNREYSGHQFIDRDESIPKWILDQAPVLDDLIYVPKYEDVEEAFYGSGDTGAPGQEERHAEGEPLREAELACPFGAVIGVDYWAFQECEQCNISEACAQMAPPATPEAIPESPQPTRRVATAASQPGAVDEPEVEHPQPQRPLPIRRPT